MRVLVNLMPIKNGGGQQVASNFITQILKNQDFKPFFLVTENTHIHKVLLKKGYEDLYVIKKGLVNRFLFQEFTLRTIVSNHNIEIIYTMFGPGLHSKKVKSVTGCAYSNLFFPEIEFWKGYSFMKKIQLNLIDKYRLKNTLKSDFIIFENESMQQRAVDLFKYPKEQTKLILPSISTYPDSGISNEFDIRLKEIDASKFNFLILSGWHKNKNIEIVPHILYNLKNAGIEDVSFVISVPKNHPDSLNLKEVATELSVEKNILFFDAVSPSEVAPLFEKIDAVALFSLLESFSNNIIESWYFKKPLFISDEEWSHVICKDAAIYVERTNALKISEAILNFRKDNELQSKLKKSVELIIRDYPNPKEKVDLQLNFLKKIS